jgi:hypothetical protein
MALLAVERVPVVLSSHVKQMEGVEVPREVVHSHDGVDHDFRLHRL